jgi:lipoprotein NlpD
VRLLRAAVPAFACGLLVVACTSAPPRAPAPVFDRPVTRANAPKPAAAPAPQKPETYTVKRGDTLYSIALDNGVDYRELAAWNGLADPSVVKEGTVLRLRPPQAPLLGAPEARAPAQADTGVQVQPIVAPGAVEARALGEQRSAAEQPRAGGAPLAPAEAPRPELLKTGPKATKLPYSEENVAAAMRLSPPEIKAEAEPAPGPSAQSDGVDWMWPASGKVLANLPKGANKGVDILGKIGDPVFASASGRVVYSGTGLRGYGKLVIIKHNETYLSTYAHNSNLLVKQGDNVVKGQKIAEIGNTDSPQAKLTFEIRKLGKPVDPLQLLPEKRS